MVYDGEHKWCMTVRDSSGCSSGSSQRPLKKRTFRAQISFVRRIPDTLQYSQERMAKKKGTNNQLEDGYLLFGLVQEGDVSNDGCWQGFLLFFFGFDIHVPFVLLS
jgi:hypothetical protein